MISKLIRANHGDNISHISNHQESVPKLPAEKKVVFRLSMYLHDGQLGSSQRTNMVFVIKPECWAA